jgi:hypothetical protein
MADMGQLDRHKLVPYENVVEIAERAAVFAGGLPPKEEKLLELISLSCPVLRYHGRDHCRLSDMNSFIKNMLQAIKNEDSSFLLVKRGMCVDRVVDIEEFVKSGKYMGQGGSVRPHVMAGLIELFGSDQYIEVCLSGSTGWGKTYFSELAIAYMIYRLSCYHNPQIEFDLAPGSSIFFIQQSKKFELAKKVVFEQFAERLKLSGYFPKFFPFDPGVKSELRFPKNIYVLPVGGSDSSALGMNVYGGIIDELNFMVRTSDSEMTRFTGEEEYDQAERVYNTLIRRIKGRFMQKGKVPGKLLLVSSVNYPGDFTDRKKKEAQTDKTILPLSYSQWEVLPKDRFCGENFLVEIGDDVRSSRIITTKEEAANPEDVLEVPVEYRPDFDRNLEGALKDYAGRTTGTSTPFIPYRELIAKAAEEHKIQCLGRQLFLFPSVVIDDVIDDYERNWEDLVDMAYVENMLSVDVPFTVHIDVALTQDCAGIAVAHLGGYKLLPASKYYDHRAGQFVEVRDARAPIYHVDGVLRVRPPRDKREIDLELVRDLVIWIKGLLNIKYASLDSWQSRMMIQGFRKSNIRSGVLSVDENIAPYAELKSAIKDERILYPTHEVLQKELRELERDRKRIKVDHPAGGSKDCSDAVAGCVYILQNKEASYGRPTRARRGSDASEEQTEDQAKSKVRHIHIGRRRLLR